MSFSILAARGYTITFLKIPTKHVYLGQWSQYIFKFSQHCYSRFEGSRHSGGFPGWCVHRTDYGWNSSSRSGVREARIHRYKETFRKILYFSFGLGVGAEMLKSVRSCDWFPHDHYVFSSNLYQELKITKLIRCLTKLNLCLEIELWVGDVKKLHTAHKTW